MKADATLVNAAFALGQSYVPADYSSIFEKQYEGIIAANAAKYKMYGDIATSAGSAIGKAAAAYGTRKGLSKALDEAITKNPWKKPKYHDKRAKAEEEQQKWLDEMTGDDKAMDPSLTPGAGEQYQMGGGFGEAPPTYQDAYGDGNSAKNPLPPDSHTSKPSTSGVPPTKAAEEGKYYLGHNNITYLFKDGKYTEVDAPIEIGGSEAYPAAGEGEFVIDDEINTMASDYVVSAMSGLDAHFKNGKSSNDMQFDAAQTEFERIKTELEDIANKLFPSKKDKRKRTKLRKEALALQSTLNNSGANIKTKAELFANDEVYLAGLNRDITINGVNHLGPDLSFLVAQIFDPNTTKSDQVEFFFENGEKMIRYAPGRAGIIYNKGKGIKGKKIPKSEWKTISENQLLNQIQPKDKATNIALVGGITDVMDLAEKMVGETDNPEITNFDDIYDRVYKGNVETLSGKNVNLTYAAREDQLAGNTIVNFSKDYLKNWKVDWTIVNQAGIGSDILTMADINNDGFINKLDTDFAKSKGMAELRKHKAAKNAFIKKLTNPQTQAEKNVLIGELAEYWTEHNRTAFNDRRKKMGLDKKDPAWKELGFSDYGKYVDWLNKDPNAKTPYKNKKVEDMVHPLTGKKFTMWSDDIIKLQNRLSNVMKSGTINQIVPVQDQMYHWSDLGDAKLKGWRKVEKKEDGKFYFIDDDGNVIKEEEARIYPTIQKVFDEQGVLFQGGSGTSKTAADYINE